MRPSTRKYSAAASTNGCRQTCSVKEKFAIDDLVQLANDFMASIPTVCRPLMYVGLKGRRKLRNPVATPVSKLTLEVSTLKEKLHVDSPHHPGAAVTAPDPVVDLDRHLASPTITKDSTGTPGNVRPPAYSRAC